MPVRAILKKIFRKKSDKVDDDDMPKRKAESAVVEEMPKPKKTIVTATDGGYSTQQKTAIAEFSEVTGIRDQKSAAKLLKSHNYQVTAAVNA
ncbi:Scaffold-type E3 ligase [Extremus antarcticus]|uniref:Scaffold-type E3 ligase n=1 Tax=Extremus antarcticus TaxID=702011 RepID=A0AAJ0GK11_9PEZI|nr:Scaffold-type E3 ligase [Extremus antarcticus]